MRMTTFLVASVLCVDAFSTQSAVSSARSMVRPQIPMAFRPARSTARTSAPVLAESPSLVERGAAALPFLFPFCDGFSYGAYIYKNVPIVGDAAYTVAPLVMAFEGLPFVGLILFLGLSYFSRNLGLSRFVRFSIQQALILDIGARDAPQRLRACARPSGLPSACSRAAAHAAACLQRS
jgi:hypothetical protein